MNIQKMMKQAQRMQEQLAAAQANLATKSIEATAGGGKIVVTASGTGDIQKIKIDPSVVDPQDVEMLEDLILAGIQKAQEDARNAAAEDMGKITGGLNIPGLNL